VKVTHACVLLAGAHTSQTFCYTHL